MKYILPGIILVLSMQWSLAQNADSVAIKLQRLEAGIMDIKNNLNKSHDEFKSGTIAFSLGLGIGVAGYLLKPDSSYTYIHALKTATVDRTYKDLLLVAGGVGIFIGEILWIDSHRYIGKAGRWHFKENGVEYDF